MDEFLTVAEVAEPLKLNQQTVRNWIDQCSLPALKVGRRVRIRSVDLEAFVERGRITPASGDPLAALEAVAEHADGDLQQDLRALIERHRAR